MEGVYKPFEYLYVGEESPSYSESLREGPLKGLQTSVTVSERYNASLRDLDIIKNHASGEPVMVIGTQPYMNLYLDLPYSSFTGWYTNESGRLLSYWTLYPEKQPSFIYVSYYLFGGEFTGDSREDVAEVLSWFSSYRTVEGEAGYIIEVTSEFQLDE